MVAFGINWSRSLEPGAKEMTFVDAHNIIVCVGTKNLFPEEFCTDSHSYYLNNIHIKKKEKGKTLHNGKLKQLISLNSCIITSS